MISNLHEIQMDWAGEENAFIGQTNPEAPSIQVGNTSNQTGNSPMDLFLLSLAGCTTMTLRWILTKMKQPIEDMQVKARGWSTEENPNAECKLYDEILVEYSIWGDGVDPQKVESAIHMTDEKYCPVSKMVSRTAKIQYEFHIYKSREKS
jgi:putative redox protein